MAEWHPSRDATTTDPNAATGPLAREEALVPAGGGDPPPLDARDRMLFNANPHPMWIFDVESLAFLDVNEAAVRRYGYTRGEFLAMTIADIRPPEDGDTLRDDVAGPPDGSTGWRHRLKDGSVVAVEVSSTAIDFGGRRARLVMATDITARLGMEEALRRAEAKYRGIFEHALEGIFQTSPEGRYLDANPALARIYGYDSAAELIAGLTDIGRQLYVDPGRRIEFARLMREHDAVSGLESQVRRRDGRVIWISESSRAVRDAVGRLLYYEGIVEDITHRKRAEEEIRALNAELGRRLERLAALRCIDVAIIEGRDLGPTLDVCLDQVITQLRPDAAVILLCDPDSQSLYYAAGRGLRTEVPRHTPHTPGQGLARRAASERRIMHAPHLARDLEEVEHSPYLTGEEFVSYYAVPLVAKDEVKGVLEIFHRTPLDPTAEWLGFLETLAGQAAIAIDNAWLFDDLRRSNAELAAAYDATIEGWSRALDLRDQETEGHSRRVTELTLRLAHAMGIPGAELVHVRRGALLHDIGKMGIPDRILHKPGPLTEEEWQVMRRHPQYAREMLQPVAFLRPALEIPYCHHERWDGTGYPRGLKGEEIPLAARIFAVVDVWDALRSDRPYRPAWSERRVCEHLRSLAGTHLEPVVVEVFLRTPASERLEAAGLTPGPEPLDGFDDDHANLAPRDEGSEQEESPFERVSRPAGREGMTILVAEDSSSCANELARMLETLGHTVLFASDDDAAWRVVQRAVARLVITDWTTTGIDGPRLCRRIRGLAGHPYTYIIVMTARGASADRLECLHAGADDFLAKPTDLRELAARLEIARRILAMQEELERKNARLAELATVDALTGLKNRRHFREELEAAFSLATRNDQALSIVMLDVDDFKRYNDTFGHPAGDELLCALAGLLRSSGREHDVVARYGGEEFAILLPGTDAPGGRVFAERLRAAVENYSWPLRPVTASFGVATVNPGDMDPEALVARADQALYRSKQRGRNFVT
jgi:diguanylate cyclase (GGDEF)-like protein/PAS domain S-box-containing protein/putative nucleotidyltransferase with HDIG domain